MKDKKYRHMTLATYDIHGWNGWWVRLIDLRQKPKKKYASITFNANAYSGDMDKAERAARRWRNKMLVECGYPSSGTIVPSLSCLASCSRKDKKGSDTDLPIGVYRADKVLKNGKHVYGYSAFIAPEPMKSLTKRMNYNPDLIGDEKRVLKVIKKIREDWMKKYYNKLGKS